MTFGFYAEEFRGNNMLDETLAALAPRFRSAPLGIAAFLGGRLIARPVEQYTNLGGSRI
jgi:hypothetical protein